VGVHDGIAGFTIGQRRGIGIIATGEKRYVTDIDPALNVITVGPEEDLLSSALVVENANWIAGQTPGRAVRAHVKIRYRTSAAPATVTPLEQRGVRVEFDAPQRAITPGQAAVFYDGDEVIGGGAILRAERD
jgi:tRNA-specific 2-thiouridylase